MSRDASIIIDFAAGSHKFRLGLVELEKLQDAMDCGPAHAIQLLSSGQWRTQHIRETIRWGLIGGGMSATDAAKLLKAYVDEMPWLENLMTAQAILMAALVGSKDEPVGDQESPKDQAATDSQMEKFPLPPSTEMES
jgi:Phage tail tube protein, GTA-gp10